VTIDVGTGDGRAVLDAAAREPATLVLGLDASAAAMAEVSRRAAGPARRGGRPNARFLVAAAETPPAAIQGIADLVSVRFPWGSLLRGCVGLDAPAAAGVAALVAPGGTLELLLAPSARDGLDSVPLEVSAVVAGVAAAFDPFGLAVSTGRPASAAEVAGSGSTWAKRLRHGDATGRSGADRSVTLVRLSRDRAR
jgi:16S rRNA (adenine(1408)-N(1))-methyltransferase